MADPVRSIVIVGGGVVGWMAAAALARVLKADRCSVRVVEGAPTERDPSETTTPALHRLHNLLGLNEADLMRRTSATFKLGSEFRDWGAIGARYFHGFGAIGAKLDAVSFHAHWLRLRARGDPAPIETYSVAAAAARAGKFAHQSADPGSILSLFSYGYHLDARAYAHYLRDFAHAHGVVGSPCGVADVELDGENGFITALRLDDGNRLEADFFIDCTGLDAVLSSAVGGRFEDWRRWLPCDRALVVSSPQVDLSAPFTSVRAGEAGWIWRVPLQQRADYGHCYCSAEISDDAAFAGLMAALEGRDFAEPRFLRFSQGRPSEFWRKNCLVLPGDALEPLEGARLQFVQTGIMRLVTIFPERAFQPADAAEYNRLTIAEYERVRDFLILHYKLTRRTDSAFWRACATMNIPEELKQRIDLFQKTGRLLLREDEPFEEASWLSVLLGQGMTPRSFDPLAEIPDAEQVTRALKQMSDWIEDGVNAMPTQRDFIAGYCRSAEAAWT